MWVIGEIQMRTLACTVHYDGLPQCPKRSFVVTNPHDSKKAIAELYETGLLTLSEARKRGYVGEVRGMERR